QGSHRPRALQGRRCEAGRRHRMGRDGDRHRRLGGAVSWVQERWIRWCDLARDALARRSDAGRGVAAEHGRAESVVETGGSVTGGEMVRRFVAILGVFFVFIPPALHAQAAKGALPGNLTDQGAPAPPGASVTTTEATPHTS